RPRAVPVWPGMVALVHRGLDGRGHGRARPRPHASAGDSGDHADGGRFAGRDGRAVRRGPAVVVALASRALRSPVPFRRDIFELGGITLLAWLALASIPFALGGIGLGWDALNHHIYLGWVAQ